MSTLRKMSVIGHINSVTDEWSSVKVRRKENKQKYSDQCTNLLDIKLTSKEKTV